MRANSARRIISGSRRRTALAVLAAWLAAQVVIAWAPFRLDPPRMVGNGAQTSRDGVLTFSGDPARARADPPEAWTNVDELRVELTVRADRASQHGPARVLAVEGDHQHSNLVIGHEDTDLIVRVRRPSTGATVGVGRETLRLDGIFARPGWRDITVDIGTEIRVTVDGVEAAEHRLADDPFDVWDQSFPITVGDAVTGDRPWHGTIRAASMTIDGRHHDLLAAAAFEVPDRFVHVPSRLRDVVDPPDATEFVQGGVHLLLWIPAGALAAMLWPGQRRWRLVGIAGGLAFALQLGKVAIAARHPSLVDVSTQAAGVLIGVLLVDTASRSAAARSAIARSPIITDRRQRRGRSQLCATAPFATDTDSQREVDAISPERSTPESDYFATKRS